MIFSSYEFMLVFMPVTLAGFFLCTRIGPRAAVAWLAAASVVFYARWNVAYVPLLLGSIAFNYCCGMLLLKRRADASVRMGGWLAFAVAANLALLGYYKYANFFLNSVDALTGFDLHIAGIVLPLGISFFTFTQIAFLVDAARGKVRDSNPLNYLLFVTYFPHLIAGPIIHHAEMMPQFSRAATLRLDAQNVALGLTAFAIGLLKKVLIADSLARFATPVFATAALQHVSFYESWIGVLAYTLQLYFDFSGYCDMALGLSLFVGVRLPLNFNSPYQAADIADFWRRWHMTLSRFLRDYLYIPLGGNRHGVARTYLNLMITMLLGGLWHGAAWTFVVWGGLHGAYLVVHRLWSGLPLAKQLQGRRAWRPVATALTFVCVVVAWVFFRADSMPTATRLLGSMFDVRGMLILPEQIKPYLGALAQTAVRSGFEFQFGSVPLILEGVAWIAVLLPAVVLLPNTQRILGTGRISLDADVAGAGVAAPPWMPVRRWAVVVGLLIAGSLLSLNQAGEFLYYQF
jgi:alginate O-acetyltransferase complex protein AlgI